MFCHSIPLSSLLPNPVRSRNENTFLSSLARTMPYARLPVQVMRDVMMVRSPMKRLVVQHQHAGYITISECQ
jgi:hypothetical protein